MPAKDAWSAAKRSAAAACRGGRDEYDKSKAAAEQGGRQGDARTGEWSRPRVGYKWGPQRRPAAMKVVVREAANPAASVRTPALCALVDPGAADGPVLGLGSTGSKRVDGAVADAAKRALAGRRARLGHTAAIDTMGLAAPRMIILAWAAGRGRRAAVSSGGAGIGGSGDAIRHAAGAAARAAADAGCAGMAFVAPPGADAPQSAAHIIEGARLSLYSFDRYKSAGAARRAPRSLTVVVRGAGESRSARMKRAVAQAGAGADGSIIARDTANLPPNECPPAGMASAARSVCAASPALRCSVMSGAALKKGGFGGILAVGGGSANGPCMVTIEYRGGKAGGGSGRRLRRPVVVVGKAVTFDTGGISLKPRDKMDEMKFDKCGGCAVLGIMAAAAAMRLPLDVAGIIPSAENMPGGGSYRPGDVVRLRGGRTAEILNTDAEGRLLLADAISYAESEYSPRCIIDLATLTGACVVALGANTAGLFSNDDALAGRLLAASGRTSEAVWRLPLGDEHMDMVRSRVADIKNMGTGRAAGAAAAAAFLRAAVGSTPWAHIDIAGTAWTQVGTAKKPYNPSGATGFGVRLILDYLAGLSGPAGEAAEGAKPKAGRRGSGGGARRKGAA